MARLHSTRAHAGARSDLRGAAGRILVVDDDPTLLASTQKVLAREGHHAEPEPDPLRAIDRVREWKPDLVLLDYFMPQLTGGEVVRAVRAFDPMVQILLVTGYASEAPARQLLAELDIQGYHDKADGPERLLVLVDSALKHHAALKRLDRQRRALGDLLEAAGELGRLQPAPELFERAVHRTAKLMSAPSCLLLTGRTVETLRAAAGIGDFARLAGPEALPPALLAVAQEGCLADGPRRMAGGLVILPMTLQTIGVGCLVLHGCTLGPDDVEPAALLARQVAMAVDNALLFERATVDPLTGLSTRGFGAQRLRESLALATRSASETAILLLDIDRFKTINDSFGHPAGDAVLRTVAEAVQQVVRATDTVVRWGGEEILVVTPFTGAAGGLVLAERIRAAVEAAPTTQPGGSIAVTASIGVAIGAPGSDADDLIARADRALYLAKAQGRNRVRLA